MTRTTENQKNQTVLNNLVNEKSPYLLQHAGNPVNWQAWGETAFAEAVGEDKPILLSIGYSTCHWCHVMAEESFSDPDIAEIMNRAFINIKLDREERPDIDHIYISAVSALNGSAGWPLNVFLTPDGRPFFGGTYFPPNDRSGMTSWRNVLLQIERAWRHEDTKEKILASAGSITEALKKHLAETKPQSRTDSDGNTDDGALIKRALETFQANFDKTHGGFSRAPKFPMPPVLNFLLASARLGRRFLIDADQGQIALDMAVRTLAAMAGGGIFDHLGGGFHRYSTDQRWHLPHFEKMLYDNAQLATLYLDAHVLTGEQWPAEVAEATLAYMLRDLMHAEGGFYSAEDADSLSEEIDGGKKREGGFYGWRLDEIRALLSPEAAGIMTQHYGLKPEGNVEADPFNEFEGINVLYQARTVPDTTAFSGLAETRVRKILSHSRRVLFEAREHRPRPHRDDKILTAWNGLTLSALARGGLYLKNNDFTAAAQKTARFLRDNLYDEKTGSLLRRWRDGQGGIEGLAEDYIFLAQGLLDLYQVDFDPAHLSWSLALAEQFHDRFYDASTGTCYAVSPEHDRHLILRPTDNQDNVLPSAASTAAMTFLRLAALTGNEKYEITARNMLESLRPHLKQQPVSAPLALAAMGYRLSGPDRIIIVGRHHHAGTRSLIETVRAVSPAVDVLLIEDPDDMPYITERLPAIQGINQAINPADPTPTAFVCTGHACRPPVDNPDALRDILIQG